MNYENIEKEAQSVLEKIEYKLDVNKAIDIIDVAKKMGFSVGNAAITDDTDGFIIVDPNAQEILGIKTKKLIGVNSKKILEWKRFIVAHEIGHYVLHYENEKNKMYAHREHKKGKDKNENEAVFFCCQYSNAKCK